MRRLISALHFVRIHAVFFERRFFTTSDRVHHEDRRNSYHLYIASLSVSSHTRAFFILFYIPLEIIGPSGRWFYIINTAYFKFQYQPVYIIIAAAASLKFISIVVFEHVYVFFFSVVFRTPRPHRTVDLLPCKIK